MAARSCTRRSGLHRHGCWRPSFQPTSWPGSRSAFCIGVTGWKRPCSAMLGHAVPHCGPGRGPLALTFMAAWGTASRPLTKIVWTFRQRSPWCSRAGSRCQRSGQGAVLSPGPEPLPAGHRPRRFPGRLQRWESQTLQAGGQHQFSDCSAPGSRASLPVR
jgi:hypothetical protein